MTESSGNPVIHRSFLPRGSVVSVASVEEGQFSWCQILRLLQKQERSVQAGMFICLTALVMNFSYFYYDFFDRAEDVFEGKHGPMEILAASMWYIGACTGAICCGFNRYTWPARMTNLVGGAVLIGANVLICLQDYVWTTGNTAICIARLLAGSTYGFTYITVMTQIGDNIWKMTRGYVASTMSHMSSIALLIAFLFSEKTWRTVASYHFVAHILYLLFALFGMGLTLWFTYEPVTRFLGSDDTSTAERIFTEICNDVVEPNKIRSEMQDKVKMMAEDYSDEESCWCSWLNLFSNGNGKPIVGMILLRILNVLTSNLFIIAASAAAIYGKEIFLMQIIVICVRILVLFLPKYSLDKLGRKALLAISGIGSGICFIPFAFYTVQLIPIRGDLIALITILMHIFAAFGIEPVQHVYAAEAFPLSKRNASLAFVTCVEYIFSGIMIIWWLNRRVFFLKFVLFVAPVFLIIVTIILFVKLPETKSKSARSCRAKFNKYYNRRPILKSRVSSIQTIGRVYM